MTKTIGRLQFSKLSVECEIVGEKRPCQPETMESNREHDQSARASTNQINHEPERTQDINKQFTSKHQLIADDEDCQFEPIAKRIRHHDQPANERAAVIDVQHSDSTMDENDGVVDLASGQCQRTIPRPKKVLFTPAVVKVSFSLFD